jgi:glycosyltransferase involved in cell wall biosynthesis
MNILHVFRMPVGGLFRHVRDLVRGQSGLGHRVGLVCDSTTGGAMANALLADIQPMCSLGIHRVPISRLPGWGDIAAAASVARIARQAGASIIHCHGAKGGFYGRLAGYRLGVPTVYTPHGGSLHYAWKSPPGAAFLAAEMALARIGSGFHFVCEYERDTFLRKIGLAGKPHAVIYNGLWPEEFATVTPEAAAADFLFIGEMRLLKGVDIFLQALAEVNHHRPATACLLGDGAEQDKFLALASSLGLGGKAHFAGRMTAREAFPKGRTLVIPSRAESFPYIVLEACAACVPMLASDVGGIPEVADRQLLVPPGDTASLARRMLEALDHPETLAAAAKQTQRRVAQTFRADGMAAQIVTFYRSLGANG